jgi:hypothetical protein
VPSPPISGSAFDLPGDNLGMSLPRARAFSTLPVTLAFLAASTASAQAEMPRDAAAFRDSVGVNTHVSYYDTVYGKWSTVLDKVQALGVTHLRDGLFGNPTWRDWNKRYNASVQAAAVRGIRFTMVMGHPGFRGGTIDNLVAAAAGPAAGAVEAFEGPNEYDISGDPNWSSALRAYQGELYTKLKANPATRGLPVLGPSLVYARSRTTLGNLEAALDQGNLHPYTGGESPSAAHMASEAKLASKVSGSKPPVATEFGFHNAMAGNASQPPVSESVAAVYAVRTYLEHFRAGIKRSFAYEIVDLHADRSRTNSEHNWGLLRNDWTEKPAYVALKKLLATVGNLPPLSVAHDLPLTVSGDTTGVNRLLLERADGTYLLALWQNASLWDTQTRQPLTVPAKTVQVDLGGSTTARIHRPADSSTPSELAFPGGPSAVTVPADPVILEFTTPKSVVHSRPRAANAGAGGSRRRLDRGRGHGGTADPGRREKRRNGERRHGPGHVGQRQPPRFRAPPGMSVQPATRGV